MADAVDDLEDRVDDELGPLDLYVVTAVGLGHVLRMRDDRRQEALRAGLRTPLSIAEVRWRVRG